MIIANIEPSLITWARIRDGKEISDLIREFPEISDWEDGTEVPEVKRLKAFSKSIYPLECYFYPNLLRKKDPST